MKIKMIQYPNNRHPDHTTSCTYAEEHPKSLEPVYRCSDGACRTCLVVHETRIFVNLCYEYQHRVCTVPEITGIQMTFT